MLYFVCCFFVYTFIHLQYNNTTIIQIHTITNASHTYIHSKFKIKTKEIAITKQNKNRMKKKIEKFFCKNYKSRNTYLAWSEKNKRKLKWNVNVKSIETLYPLTIHKNLNVKREIVYRINWNGNGNFRKRKSYKKIKNVKCRR